MSSSIEAEIPLVKILDSVVVGAGLSGLTVAHRLKDSGQSVLVLDKSKGVGGRMATRRDEDSIYDHGAQFYKHRSDQPFYWDRFWSEQGLVREWFERDGFSHRIAPSGLTRLAKALAAGLEVRLNHHVSRLEVLAKEVSGTRGVQIDCKDGARFFARQVFLSCPLPQSLMLLKQSGVSYDKALDDVRYAPALVGLFRVESRHRAVNEWSFQDHVSDAISSVANQLNKGPSSQLAFVVVMTGDWSAQRFDLKEEEVQAELTDEFLKFWAGLRVSREDVSIERAQVKKWRYSHPLTLAEGTHLTLENSLIHLIGDGFGGGSLAGAVRSALSVPVD